ncbi:MAG: MFS transporter [Armatimonadetes bacterium]|nr:MFS transporter [Armatimonadota bacterium]
MLNDFSSEMIYPLMPLFFTTVLGAGPLALGAMEGLVDSLASLLKIGSGRLSDRLPQRKPLLFAGYALAALTRPFLALAAAPWQVFALRVVDRTGKGIRGAPRDALIADTVAPSERGRAFGFHRSMDHAGAIVGPLAALVAIQFFFGGRPLREGDYRLLFGLAALPALASLAVILVCVRERPADSTRSPAARAAPPPLPRSLRYLFGILLLFALGNSSDAFLLLRARSVGLTERDLYLIWPLLHVVRSLLAAPAGALSDRAPRKLLIVSGWVVYALVYLGFGLATRPGEIWLLFGLYGLYTGLVEGSERALVADLAPPAARGAAFGWYNAAAGLAAFPASAGFGWLWHQVSPAAAFGVGAGLALVAAFLLLFLPLRAAPTPAPG